MLEKVLGILAGIFDKLTTLEAILFFLLIASWVSFYFIIKILWEAYKSSQENRIEENKQMIKVQESTTTALNNLSKVVEVGFGIISSIGKK